MDTMENHFWAKVDKTDTCWLWTGGKDTGGYGALRVKAPRLSNKKVRASRYSWELHNGPIPEGLWVLHTCDVRHCVNPAHLWLGTRQDNVDDMKAKGRQAYANKTHCKWGHPLFGDNLYQPEERHRACRTCRRRYALEWKQRQRTSIPE